MSGSGRGMRKTTRRNPCIASLSLLSRATYYLKPDESEAPEDLAAKGVHPVRAVIADTGEVIQPETEPTTGETNDDDEG